MEPAIIGNHCIRQNPVGIRHGWANSGHIRPVNFLPMEESTCLLHSDNICLSLKMKCIFYFFCILGLVTPSRHSPSFSGTRCALCVVLTLPAQLIVFHLPGRTRFVLFFFLSSQYIKSPTNICGISQSLLVVFAWRGWGRRLQAAFAALFSREPGPDISAGCVQA